MVEESEFCIQDSSKNLRTFAVGNVETTNDMKQILLALFMLTSMTACAQRLRVGDGTSGMDKTYKVKITFEKNGTAQTLTATFDDNATTSAIIAKMPMTLPMMDLYGDEMCYRFPDALPTDNVEYKLHKKGEIFYWPPSHSFVIRYIETDEWLNLQHLGQVDNGVDILNGIGDINMTFELIDDTSAIQSVKSDGFSTTAVYTLNGRRVPDTLDSFPHGIYVVAGKKIIR